MKIKTKKISYEEYIKLPPKEHVSVRKQSPFVRFLVRFLSRNFLDLKDANYKSNLIGMGKLGKDEKCLVLMNHSSFIDFEIVADFMNKRPYGIVATSDSFIGKKNILRAFGCIATDKFVPDITLVRDIQKSLKLGNSVVMYPEASYSFDGTATPLPTSIGQFIRLLSVPVIMIRTYGAFQRDPLYNNLQKRKVNVSADIKYLLSPEEIKNKTASEINDILKEEFSFDNFKWQQDNKVKVSEPFRADYLNRVLYKCPHCQKEGMMEGKGIYITCNNCSEKYELDEYGYLKNVSSGNTIFNHIPTWYNWERECVKKEIDDGTYNLDIPVKICSLVDCNSIYEIGEGRLYHGKEGFHLTGCDGKLDYIQSAVSSYSLYSDYHWYEIGDMICIGSVKGLFYCFPQVKGDFVAKTRLAAEELYKIKIKELRKNR